MLIFIARLLAPLSALHAAEVFDSPAALVTSEWRKGSQPMKRQR